MQTMVSRWTIGDVAAVLLLRVGLGVLVARLLLPALGLSLSWLELFDRAAIVLLIWYIAIKVRRAHWSDLGIQKNNLVKDILIGFAAGAVLLLFSSYSEKLYVTLIHADVAQHPLVTMAGQANSFARLLSPLFLAGVAAPVAEELLYRAFLLPPLAARLGGIGAIGISSLIFALLHFNVYWLGEIAIVGAGLAVLYWWRRSLLACVTAHSLLNSTKILMFYYGVSV